MKIRLFLNKNAAENAEYYYSLYKKYKKKAEGVKNILSHLKDKLEEEKKKSHIIKPKRKEKKQWYEKYRYFFTKNGFLVIAGMDLTQNEVIFRKYIEKNDLVFHAEIRGAPLTVLKSGINAKEEDIIETAQFAASYSKAWQIGFSSLNVFYVGGNNVSKYSTGEYVEKGSFMFYGERKYIKNIELGLKIMFEDDRVYVIPKIRNTKGKKYITIIPGRYKKQDIIKKILKRIKSDPNMLQKLIPENSVIEEFNL